MTPISYIKKKLSNRFVLFGLVVMAGLVYFFIFRQAPVVTTDTYAVVETVGKGSVSSGIQTSGTIVAAKKLDLDVYKQARRIEAVNVSNASHVDAGTVLFSFDKSGAFVAVESTKVSIAEAELALATEQANIGDVNTTLRTLKNTLVTLHADIVEAEKDLIQAKRDFLNADLTSEPGNVATTDKTPPTLSGVYNGTAEGSYTVEVYRSGADSGYSYRVSGLEKTIENLLTNIATPLGTRGLKITFPTDVRSGDVWLVSVPNTDAPEYMQNKEDYQTSILELETLIASKRVSIANTELDIKNQEQTDTTPYRDLDVDKAAAGLAKARQQLSENYDVVQEQDIVAPFAGTVEGLENVVVGATPTGNTNDTISLGTLISDEFLVNFSLSAVDVGKVTVGQKVLVSVTSFPGAIPLEAHITEVSSLPESEGVAQYEVQALISNTATTSLKLREGLLASIEVVQSEVPDVLRVPVSALSYTEGKASVEVVGNLTPEQQTELTERGVIKSINGTFPTYAVPVEVGVTGTFYVEIKSGLSEGMQVLVTKTDPGNAVIEQDMFGPPDEEERQQRAEARSAP